MASTNDTDDSLDCSICHKLCNGPRKRPECGHYCCEICILIHVSKLKDDGDQEIGFQCLTCEVMNPGPKDLKAAIGWIKSLERGTNAKAKAALTEEKQKHLCMPCKSIERLSTAVKFCLDCSEGLCQSCSLGRHSHPLLRKHSVIDTGFGNDQTEERGDVFQMMCNLTCCETHTMYPIAFFCKDHEEYGCELCIDVKHSTCIDVVKASDMQSPREELNSEAEILKDAAESLHKYTNIVTDIKNTYRGEYKKQIDLIRANLKAIRESASAVLDSLEKKITTDIELKANDETKDAQRESIIFKQLSTESMAATVLLERVMSFGCQSQQRILIQMLRKKMRIYEETAVGMSTTVKTTKIEFKLEDMLVKFLNIGKNNTNQLFTVIKKKDEGIIPPYQSRLLLEHYNIKKVKKISTVGKYDNDSPTYSGEIILRNDNIVLVDSAENFSVMIKQDDETVDALSLRNDFQSFNVKLDELLREASKKARVVAVPGPTQNQILLLSVKEGLAIIGEVKTLFRPKALHVCRNGDIAVAWEGPVAFGIISVGKVLNDTKVYFRRDRSGRELRSFQYMAVDEKKSRVIQPCTVDSAVYCFDYHGNPKFKCSGIGTPYGVALDADANIYACCSDSSIYTISYSGKILRKIGTSEGCPLNPRAIAFNKSGEEFAVTQGRDGHNIIIFKLEKS